MRAAVLESGAVAYTKCRFWSPIAASPDASVVIGVWCVCGIDVVVVWVWCGRSMAGVSVAAICALGGQNLHLV